MSIWLIPVVVLAFVWGTYRLRKRQLADLADYEYHANAFYEAAQPLVNDDETPVSILELLDFMNHKVSDKRAAREFYQLIASGRINPMAGHMSPQTKEVREFLGGRPELEQPFLRVIGHGLLAMTHRSIIWGSRVRLWLTAIDTVERQEEVAYTYRDLDKHDGPRLQAAAA